MQLLIHYLTLVQSLSISHQKYLSYTQKKSIEFEKKYLKYYDILIFFTK